MSEPSGEIDIHPHAFIIVQQPKRKRTQNRSADVSTSEALACAEWAIDLTSNKDVCEVALWLILTRLVITYLSGLFDKTI